MYIAVFVHFIFSKMAAWTKHGVCLHSGCSSAKVNIKLYRYFWVEVTASVTLPFHLSLNEPKEVSLQSVMISLRYSDVLVTLAIFEI